MTGMEFTYAVGYVDRSLVEEHIVERDRLQRAARVRRTVKRISSVAACLVALLAVVILARIMSNDIAGGVAPGDPMPGKPDNDNTAPPTDPSDWSTPSGVPGDISSDTAFSFTFEISGTNYSVTLYPDMSPTVPVDSENIGELVGSVTLKDVGLTCEVYALMDGSGRLALKLPSGEYALAVSGK